MRVDVQDATVRVTDKDGCVPDDFYSTTNQRTARAARRALDRGRAPADGCRHRRRRRAARCAASCATSARATASSAASKGIRVTPEFRDRERADFGFMTNEISSERRVEASVGRIAAMMRHIKTAGAKIAFVAGPVVVHTGGGAYFIELIRRGFVDVLLSGNALAVHDVEQALFGTSLGVDLEAGTPVRGGHRHHMRAINAINAAGGIRGAVGAGVLTSGVMVECVRARRPLRPGRQHPRRWPIADTVTDIVAAQDRYAEALAGRRPGDRAVDDAARHRRRQHAAGLGAGGLRGHQPGGGDQAADRGSSQTIGLVTDVGLFLHQLAEQLGRQLAAGSW